MSGIGGRAPRHLPVLFRGQPVDRFHRHEHLLWEPEPAERPVRRLGPLPLPPIWRQAISDRADRMRNARRVAALLRREQQRQARIAAGVDRSSPDAGPRPRWSR